MRALTRPEKGSMRGLRAPTWLRNPVATSFAIAVLLFAVGELVSPGFAAYSQVINVLRIAAFLGIIAAGQTVVILAGGEGIDLSIGAVVTFGAIIASRVINGQDALIPLGLAEALLAGLGIGLTNGVGVAYLRIPPLVMTLGMTGVVKGLILVYTKGQPMGRAAPLMNAIVSGETVFGIPGVLWIWLALAVVLTLLLTRTSFGRWIYAIGTNREAARLSGVNVQATIVLVYGLSAVLGVLGGFFLLGYTTTVFLNLGDKYMLPSIAAVVVGGTTLAGGQGGYVGTISGAIVLSLLDSLLVTLNMGEAGRELVYGVILLVLLSAYGRQRRLRL